MPIFLKQSITTMDVRHGRMMSVLNVLLTIISTRRESVVKLNPNAETLMSKLVSVKDAIKDTQSRMASVFYLILPDLMIKDAKPGKMAFVVNAQLVGTSVQITYATQLMIYAEPGMKVLELANHVTEVILLMVQNVSETLLMLPHPLILSALPGKMVNAKNVLKELTSTTESAIKLATTAEPGTILTEPVCLVIKVTI